MHNESERAKGFQRLWNERVERLRATAEVAMNQAQSDCLYCLTPNLEDLSVSLSAVSALSGRTPGSLRFFVTSWPEEPNVNKVRRAILDFETSLKGPTANR